MIETVNWVKNNTRKLNLLFLVVVVFLSLFPHNATQSTDCLIKLTNSCIQLAVSRQPQFMAQVVRRTLHILEIQLRFSYFFTSINRPSVDPSMKVRSKWYAVVDEEKLNWKTCSENNSNSGIQLFCQRTTFKPKYSGEIKTNVIISFMV